MQFQIDNSRIIFCVECKNSGQYSDDQCLGWKSLCLSDEWKQFMTDHCSRSCNFCAAGIIHDHELLTKMAIANIIR